MPKAKKTLTAEADSGASVAYEAYLVTNRETFMRYVGITSAGIAFRWRQHLRYAAAKPRRGLHGAIRKYGEGSFTVEKIGSAGSWDDLCALERQLIELHGTFAPNGYNLSLGGEGALGRIWSDEDRSLASKRGKQLSATDGWKQKVAAGTEKRSKSPGWRKNVADARRIGNSDPAHIMAVSASRMETCSNPEWQSEFTKVMRAVAEDPAWKSNHAAAAARTSKSPEWHANICSGARRRAENRRIIADEADPAGAETRAKNRDRAARHRARKAGADIPKLRPGRKPKPAVADSNPSLTVPPVVAIIARLPTIHEGSYERRTGGRRVC